MNIKRQALLLLLDQKIHHAMMYVLPEHQAPYLAEMRNICDELDATGYPTEALRERWGLNLKEK